MITHTGIRPAYGGQGIAKRLVISIIEAARSNEVKILPICSYAKKLMEGKDDFMDVLYDNDPVGPLLFISK